MKAGEIPSQATNAEGSKWNSNNIIMIVLPTKRRLERRRDALYERLHAINDASVHQVEDIMRKIHGINMKLRTYFIRENEREHKELFEDKDPIEKENPFTIQN